MAASANERTINDNLSCLHEAREPNTGRDGILPRQKSPKQKREAEFL